MKINLRTIFYLILFFSIHFLVCNGFNFTCRLDTTSANFYESESYVTPVKKSLTKGIVRIFCNRSKVVQKKFDFPNEIFYAKKVEIVDCWDRASVGKSSFLYLRKLFLKNTFVPCNLVAKSGITVEFFFSHLPKQESIIETTMHCCEKETPSLTVKSLVLTTNYNFIVKFAVDSLNTVLGFRYNQSSKIKTFQLKSKQVQTRFVLKNMEFYSKKVQALIIDKLWMCPNSLKLASFLQQRSKADLSRFHYIECETSFKIFPIDGYKPYFEKFFKALQDNKL